jgi:transcriptional regulator with XRE-family HTH domain
MTIKETIAANLKRLRKEKGWTMRIVAGKIPISHPAYANYELEKASPPIETLYRLADIYSIPITDILPNALNTEQASA